MRMVDDSTVKASPEQYADAGPQRCPIADNWKGHYTECLYNTSLPCGCMDKWKTAFCLYEKYKCPKGDPANYNAENKWWAENCAMTCKLCTVGPTTTTTTALDGCDWQCYMDRYRGLGKACGKAKDPFACAQNHWIKAGKSKGKDCTCPTTTVKAPAPPTTTALDGCDWQCYMDRYPGLGKACGKAKNPSACAQNHWIKAGKSQGKDCTCPTTTVKAPAPPPPKRRRRRRRR